MGYGNFVLIIFVMKLCIPQDIVANKLLLVINSPISGTRVGLPYLKKQNA